MPHKTRIEPYPRRKKLTVGKSSRKKRKRVSVAEFKRSWGISPKGWMRYSGIKGIYWHYFSRSVRMRDYEEHDGLCMTCMLYVDPHDAQGGHLLPARNCGFALLFHPKNVHLQHSKCNNPRFTPDAGLRNGINIERRYPGLLTELFKLKEEKQKEWSKDEYQEKIKQLPAYQQRVLDQKNP